MPGTRFATDSGTCGMCHEQTHNGPREMFQGNGGRGVADMPSPMARSRVNCIACHTGKETDPQSADVKGQTFVATQDRCDYCHGDKYKGVLADWKTMLDTNLTKAEAALLETKTAAGTAKLGAEDALQVQRAIDDAEYNIRFVKLAHGVHNPTYATALLNVALERCRTAQTYLKGGAAAP
jgi:formate-dependent nitrite reductase cytochrome c552 subunit